MEKWKVLVRKKNKFKSFLKWTENFHEQKQTSSLPSKKKELFELAKSFPIGKVKNQFSSHEAAFRVSEKFSQKTFWGSEKRLCTECLELLPLQTFFEFLEKWASLWFYQAKKITLTGRSFLKFFTNAEKIHFLSNL